MAGLVRLLPLYLGRDGKILLFINPKPKIFELLAKIKNPNSDLIISA